MWFTNAATDLVVLFPFHVSCYIPRAIVNIFLDSLSALRVISPRQNKSQHGTGDIGHGKASSWIHMRFPLNFITAPLIADLFLLAITAVGRDEVYAGTIGIDNIKPIEIMAFFLTLAYIAISIDASGLIRYLAFKVLQWGGKVGHRLFFYLYAFFFLLGSFIGNDPIILSGTAFLAYMTRVSSNIVHPRAWIHTQFAVANIASAILVSSNPTNLVLAGAFNIKFIEYTVNMIVPVVITGILLFPFLLYIIFANEHLIPSNIKMHELPEEARARRPVNPNIPHARGQAAEEENDAASDEQKLLSLEEIMNPFLDKGGAVFGGVIMTATLVAVLAVNATGKEWPVFAVTTPAAGIMAIWDLLFGWFHRKETREIARKGRLEVERARAERAERAREEKETRRICLAADRLGSTAPEQREQSEHASMNSPEVQLETPSRSTSRRSRTRDTPEGVELAPVDRYALASSPTVEQSAASMLSMQAEKAVPNGSLHAVDGHRETSSNEMDEEKVSGAAVMKRQTLVSLSEDAYRWSQQTFPTTTAVLAHLPFALVPFAFCMFVLVQGLVTKGWVPVFAYGWDHWVQKTGTVGAIGGMGFLSVILCNVSVQNLIVCSLTNGCSLLVCGHKYRHYHPSIPRHPDVGGYPCP